MVSAISTAAIQIIGWKVTNYNSKYDRLDNAEHEGDQQEALSSGPIAGIIRAPDDIGRFHDEPETIVPEASTASRRVTT